MLLRKDLVVGGLAFADEAVIESQKPNRKQHGGLLFQCYSPLSDQNALRNFSQIAPVTPHTSF